MKFYKQLIDEKGGTDKGEIMKVASAIETEMQKQGIRYSDDSFEKVADNHVVELSTRAVRGDMLKDSDNPYDPAQVTSDSWNKATEVKEALEKDFGIKLTGIETFLLSTHFMINSQEAGK